MDVDMKPHMSCVLMFQIGMNIGVHSYIYICRDVDIDMNIDMNMYAHINMNIHSTVNMIMNSDTHMTNCSYSY